MRKSSESREANRETPEHTILQPCLPGGSRTVDSCLDSNHEKLKGPKAGQSGKIGAACQRVGLVVVAGGLHILSGSRFILLLTRAFQTPRQASICRCLAVYL